MRLMGMRTFKLECGNLMCDPAIPDGSSKWLRELYRVAFQLKCEHHGIVRLISPRSSNGASFVACFCLLSMKALLFVICCLCSLGGWRIRRKSLVTFHEKASTTPIECLLSHVIGDVSKSL